MADVFISYSRKDANFVRRLHAALTAAGRDSWVDWEDIPPTAQWLNEIYAAIEAADAFVFVISPDSLTSTVCMKEVEHAVLHNKRLIPLLYRQATADTPVIEAVSSHNWIYFQATDDFAAAFQTLLTALDTDLDFVRDHTRLLVRAREWEVRDKDASYLLRGQDLAGAENWLVSSSGKEPEPSDLHTAYILASRQSATARQRMTVGALIGGLLLALILAAFALVQWNSATIAQATAVAEANRRATQENIALDNAATATVAQGQAEIEAANAATAAAVAVAAQAEAEEQARIALAGQLSAQALNQLDERLDLALILSAQAYRTADTLEARKSLLTAIISRPQIVTYLRDHQPDGFVSAVAASPDGRLIASGDDAGRVILWDASSGKRLFPRPFAHMTEVIGLGFTADSQQVHSVDLRGNIMTWDTTTGHRVAWPRQEGRFDGFLVAAFSLAGDKVALASGLTNAMRIYDTQTGDALTPRLTGYSEFVDSMAFTPDGNFLASTDLNMNIKLWDAITGAEIDRTFNSAGTVDGFAAGMTISPDGTRLAVASITQLLSVWDLESGDLLGEIAIGDEQIAAGGIAYSTDGRWLVIGTHRGGVLTIDAETLTIADFYPTQTNRVSHVAFSNTHRFVAASEDGTLTLLDLDNPSPLARVFTSGIDSAAGIAFSPDGSRLVTNRCVERNADRSCPRRELNIWDVATGERVNETYRFAAANWADLAYSPDGSLLAVVNHDGTVQLIDALTLQPVGDPLPMPEPDTDEIRAITGLAFSPDGRYLGGSGLLSYLLVWDLETRTFIGEPLTDPRAEGLPLSVLETTWSVAFSPDSRTLAIGGDEGDIRLWDSTTATLSTTLQREDFSTISALDFSPDGQILAAGDWNQKIALWDVATGRLLGQPLAGHAGSIVNLDFDPTGSLLAATSQDSAVLLWDVATGQPIGPQLNNPDLFVYDVEFSADGRWLALGGINELSLWAMDTANWSAVACERAQLNFSLPEWEAIFPNQPYTPVCPHSAAGLADFTERADLLALEGDHDRARELFTIATDWVIQTADDRESRSVCHYGFINGFAAEVMPACEHTVDHNPTYGPRYSDRGVARALTGDIEGAIADFEFFLAWLDDFQAENDVFISEAIVAVLGEPRINWIADLQAGRDPFDAETLTTLRDE